MESKQSAEFAPEGKPANFPGIYEMKREGLDSVRIITQPGDEGRVQADALVRVGYVRVGEVPSRTELLTMQKRQQARDMAEEKAAKIREEAELKSLEDEILAEAQADADKLTANKGKKDEQAS